uniref:FMRFamide-related neuropeptides n=1 Tax=Panagrellus redivivus TaxID=6233 RepID=A0A7E5A156_PANRE
MQASSVLLFGLALAFCVIVSNAQFDEDYAAPTEKRAMRNALVRFGRAAGMRNALVRFGKRSADEIAVMPDYGNEAKRNGAPQPFVRFGRSAGRIDHMHDILSTLQKIEMANGQ